MGERMDYTKNVMEAYSAVKDLTADEQYKLEGFKIVLKASLGVNATLLPQAAPVPHMGEAGSGAAKKKLDTVDVSEWSGKIAHMLEITPDQVEEIYYLDGDDDLKLIINKKMLPDSASASTQHVTALIAGGRQAMGLDATGTSFALIKDTLVANNCFNKKNWTGYIKLLGNKFLYDGKAVKLTNKAYDEVATIAKTYLEQ